MSNTTPHPVQHGMLLRHDPLWNAWWTECTGCPGWQSQPEEGDRPAAIRHHLMHQLGLAPVKREEPRAVEAPRRSSVDVDRLMGRLVGPLLLAATAAGLLWAGIASVAL